jgi:hypothetical protein
MVMGAAAAESAIRALAARSNSRHSQRYPFHSGAMTAVVFAQTGGERALLKWSSGLPESPGRGATILYSTRPVR